MKNYVLALLAVLMAVPSALQAQSEKKYGEDSAKCRENLYIYYELAKKKNWLEAYDGWKYVYENCPRSSKNNFIYGPYIVTAKMKKAEEAEKQKYKELLLEVYDNRLKYFPGKTAYVKGRKAVDMTKYMRDSSAQAYELFREALDLGGMNQNAAFYNYLFISAARMYNDDLLEEKGIFEAYNVVQEGIKTNTDRLNKQLMVLVEKRDSSEEELSKSEVKELGKIERELSRYEDVQSNVDKIIAPIATCKRLNLIYNDSTFAENKSDTLWLKRAAKMLQRKRRDKDGEIVDCTDMDIFFKISESLYDLEPSAPAARGNFILAYRDENYSKAIDYIKEAIELEVDPKDQARDYMRLARTYLQTGQLASAVRAARNAGNFRKNWGDPYILMAQAYAAGSEQCGSDAFEKGAVFYAAINKLQYAKSIDSEVSEKASSLISSYRQQLPDKGVSFQLGHSEGEKYQIGCFINETVTVEF